MDQNGTEILFRKRLRLEDCVICNRGSYDGIQKEKRDEYVKILIRNFQPPSRRKLDGFQSFEFCMDCIPILEDLLQMKMSLDFILSNIKKKVQEIKLIILKNNPKSSNKKIQSFRQFAVRDFYPRVAMSKNNILVDPVAEGKEMEVVPEVDKPVESPESQISENFDRAPSSPADDSDTDTTVSPPPNTQKVAETPSPPPNTDAPTNPTYSEDVTFVQIPKPFPTSTPTSSADLADVEEEVVRNIEDFIIVVTEPPKFVCAQFNVYFEKYRDMYKCKFCSTILKAEANMSALARHINIIHSINNRFKCAVCLAMFFSRNKCHSHLSECHFEMFRRKPARRKNLESVQPEVSFNNIVNTNCNNVNDNFSGVNNSMAIAEVSSCSPSSSVQRSSKSKSHPRSGSVFRSVSRKKTTPTTMIPRRRDSLYLGCETDCSTSTSAKYSNDKITSAEVFFEIEPKQTFNFVEEENIVKFEPWEKESSTAQSNNVDPLATNDSAAPVLKQTMTSPGEDNSVEVITLEDDKFDNSSKDVCGVTEESEASTKSPKKLKNLLKPKLSIKQLIILAMAMTKNEFMCTTVGNICKFIKENFLFYKNQSNSYTLHGKVRQALSLNYNDCPIFATKRMDDRNRLLYFFVNDEPGTKEEIGKVLKSPNFAATMAFPEKVGKFCSNLMNRRALSESEYTEMNTSTNPTNEWVRPPFTNAQLIYIALKNHPAVPITSAQIINFIEETFPFFKYLMIKWKNGIYTSLTSNMGKMFKRHETAPQRPRYSTWLIHENAPVSRLKLEIKYTISTSPVTIVESTVNPETVFKNALESDYDSSLMKPKNIGRRVGAANSPASASLDTNSQSVNASVLRGAATRFIAPKVTEDITTKEFPTAAATSDAPEMIDLEEEKEFRESPNKKWTRPCLTYNLMAALALANCTEKVLNCEGICDFIMKTFPFFETTTENWRDCVYRALTTHRYFTWNFQGGDPISVFSLNNNALPDLKMEMVETLRGYVVGISLSMANPDLFESIFGMLLHPDYDFLPYARKRIREYQQTLAGVSSSPSPWSTAVTSPTAAFSQSVPEQQPQMPMTFIIIPPATTGSIYVNQHPMNS